MSLSNGRLASVEHLRRTLLAVGGHARMIWWATTLLGILGAAGAMLLLAVFLDEALGGLPAGVRLMLLLGVFAAPALVLRWALRRRPAVSAEDLALAVEQRYPDLDNVLINTLQLADDPDHRAQAGEIVAAIANEAQEKIQALRATSAISKRALALAGGTASVAVVVLAAYALLNADAFRTALSRVLTPLADNSFTRILHVTPGDSDVLVNAEVFIEAQIGGRVPTQAEAVCTLADGRRLSVRLTPPSAAVPDRLVGRIASLEQDATYSVVAGDNRSSLYALHVHPRPAVQQITQTLTPPDYVQGKPTEQTGGAIQALAGSKVSLRIQASQPIRGGKISFADGREEPLALAPLAGKSETNTATAELIVKQNSRYELRLVSLLGFESEPSSYDIVALEDKAPQVEFVQPAGDLAVAIEAKVVVEVRASDDNAVKEVRLVRLLPADSASDETAPSRPVELARWSVQGSDQARVNFQTTLSVASLKLSETAPIVLQALAYDFRPDAAAGSSALVTIRLQEPPTPESRQGPAVVKVPLDALIAKQRANLAASEELANADAKAAASFREQGQALVERQEEIRRDAQALVAAPAPGTEILGVLRTLANLTDSLMVVAIEQLRGAAGQGDPRPALPKPIDTQRAILAALIVANARQDAELAQRQQREIAEQLAQLIARQQALRTDSAGDKEEASALSARQRVLGRDAARLQKQLAEQSASGVGGNAELAAQFEQMAKALEQRAVRANMIQAAELLANAQKPEAIKLQDQVLADLLAIQKILAAPALADAKEQVKEAAEGLKLAKEKVDKLANLQQNITEIAKQLHKTADLTDGKTTSPEELKDLVEARKDMADVVEQLVKDLHLLPDMSASNDLLSEASEVFEKVKQAPGSEKAPVSEVAVTRDEGALAALKAMQQKMGERIGDLEMWLMDKPDSVAFKQESWDKNEIGQIPLGDLPDQLEDIVGELLDKSKEMEQKAQDSVSNVGAPDGLMGWDIGDGPMPDWAAKGKSGNEKPNNNEQTGRSGSGRQGKSSGEIVGDTLKGLKGADLEARRTNDAAQAGELKEEDPGKMETKATGGGKLAGASNTEGMSGDAPPRDELKYRSLARQHTQLKHDAETVYSKARLLRLPTGELDKAVLQMDAAGRRLEAGDIEGFARAQEQVVRALKQTQAQLTGKALVEGQTHTQRDPNIVGATNEPVPKQYEDAVAQYMRNISEGK